MTSQLFAVLMEDQGEFCRFFVEAAGVAAVVDILAAALDVSFAGNSAVVRGLDIDVWNNGYASAQPRFGEDFLEWPLTVEVSSKEAPVAHDTVFDVVKRMLVALWDADIRAVVACDFEGELPWRGGIGRLSAQSGS